MRAELEAARDLARELSNLAEDTKIFEVLVRKVGQSTEINVILGEHLRGHFSFYDNGLPGDAAALSMATSLTCICPLSF